MMLFKYKLGSVSIAGVQRKNELVTTVLTVRTADRYKGLMKRTLAEN